MDFHRESLFVDFLMNRDFVKHQIEKYRGAALILQPFTEWEPFYFALLCKIAYLEMQVEAMDAAIDWMAFNVVWV